MSKLTPLRMPFGLGFVAGLSLCALLKLLTADVATADHPVDWRGPSPVVAPATVAT
jgi:hypothetical protein